MSKKTNLRFFIFSIPSTSRPLPPPPFRLVPHFSLVSPWNASKCTLKTEASIAQVRAERAVVSSQISALSAAPLERARARLAAARAGHEGAAAAKRCLEVELEAKRAQTDELRARAAALAERRAAAGRALREAAEAHAAALAAEGVGLAAATKLAGGAFLADE